MDRYKVLEEIEKNGRKKEIYYAVYDTFENRVIARYSDKKKAEALIFKYEATIQS